MFEKEKAEVTRQLNQLAGVTRESPSVGVFKFGIFMKDPGLMKVYFSPEIKMKWSRKAHVEMEETFKMDPMESMKAVLVQEIQQGVEDAVENLFKQAKMLKE